MLQVLPCFGLADWQRAHYTVKIGDGRERMSKSNHFFSVDRSVSAFRPASRQDIAYILEKSCPYLQVLGIMELPADMEDALPSVKEKAPRKPPSEQQLNEELSNILFGEQLDEGLFGEPALIEIGSGWQVHYWRKTDQYPPAMCISAGEEIIDQNIADGASVPGSITNRAFDAAAQVVLLALVREWQGIQIVSGSALMQWAAWAVAQHNNLPCFGYDPSNADQSKAERISEVLQAKYSHQPSVLRIPTPGSNTANESDNRED